MTSVCQSSVTTAQLTRETDVRGAWPMLGAVLAHAYDHPKDADAAILSLRVLVQVGLGTLAAEVIERLPSDVSKRADVQALARRASQIPRLEFAAGDRIALGRANLKSLRDRRGLDLADAFKQWAIREQQWRVLATPEGNVIRIPKDRADPRDWQWLSEQRAAARAFAQTHFGDAAANEIPPIAIEGVNPPWVFVEIANATPRLASGYQPRIRVLQRDPAEFFEGISLVDISLYIGDDRIEWYVGEEAGDRFAQRVRDERFSQSIGPGIPIGTVRSMLDPPIGELVKVLSSEAVRESAESRSRVQTRYAGRDADWWAARYERALAPGAVDPLRVLIPTTRYSTYIQHAARDLACAFDQYGAQVKVLIEPDDHTRLSPMAFHNAFETFEPDLVVLINYPRSMRAEAFPSEVPFVCWIQDEMPHLFRPEAGQSQGPLDFVVGHAVTPLFRKYGYDASQALYSPVVVSDQKFHDGPVTAEQRARFACDVAFVSNHSETPDQLHARKVAEADDPGVRTVLEAMRVGVEELADNLMRVRVSAKAKQLCRQVLRSVGASDEDAASYEMQYARPMLERIVRHRVLAMAADVCDRRGWSLRVFGRGWDQHPRFSQYACGVLDHGDDLRACYQLAHAHLHASSLCFVHQRVMECALSGGLPIGIRSLSEFPSTADIMAREQITPAMGTLAPDGASISFDVDSIPALKRYQNLLDSIGAVKLNSREMFMRPKHLERAIAHPRARGAMSFDLEWLLPKPAEYMFGDEQELERLVDRAKQDSCWRRERIARVAANVRERATYVGLIEGMLGMMRDEWGVRQTA